MGRQAIRKVDEGKSLRRLIRNLPAAFEEVRAGLLGYLRSRPHADVEPQLGYSLRKGEGRRPVRAGEPLRLHSETTIHLLRIIFLLYVEGRGLTRRRGRTDLSEWWVEVDRGWAVAQASPSRKRSGGDGFYCLWNALEESIAELARRGGCRPCRDGVSFLEAHAGWDALDLRIPDACLLRVLGLLCLDSTPSKRASEHPYANLDVRGLGDAYETILEYRSTQQHRLKGGGLSGQGRLRKLTGRYYTPRRIVAYVARRALGRLVKGLSSRQIMRIRVLDPAMGSGHFLLGAADFLAKAYGRARWREGKAEHAYRIPDRDLRLYKRLVIEKCLYGVDTDPLAVELARHSLWLEAGCSPKALHGLGSHLRCGNSLLGADFKWDMPTSPGGWDSGDGDRGSRPGCDGGSFNWKEEFPEIARSRRGGGGFDAVLGNPPYVSLSGRQKPAGQAGQCLKPRGWPSLHGVFILRATGLINDHGTICFITPGQVGLLPGYGPVRSALLEVCDLLEVRYWGEGIFRGVTTPTLTFLAASRGSKPVPDCRLITDAGLIRRFRPKGASAWYASRGRRALARLADRHGTVSTFRDTGVHTGNVAARLLSSRPRAGSVPIIEGRQVHAFHCDPPRRWLDLNYRPRGDEYFRISRGSAYEDTDIIIRQTASRPIAARHAYRCHFRNSVLALRAPEGFSVEYLLGVLNSEAARMLYHAYTPEVSQRAFPQIKVSALRRLPIPDPRKKSNRLAVARIERIVRRLEEGGVSERRLETLLGTLNRLVHSLYGLEHPQK